MRFDVLAHVFRYSFRKESIVGMGMPSFKTARLRVTPGFLCSLWLSTCGSCSVRMVLTQFEDGKI
jgi:hypothetical protein